MQDQEARPIYEVRDMATGHVWKIFANGLCEGFPKDCVVFNRVPQLVWRTVQDSHAAEPSSRNI